MYYCYGIKRQGRIIDSPMTLTGEHCNIKHRTLAAAQKHASNYRKSGRQFGFSWIPGLIEKYGTKPERGQTVQYA